MGWLLVGSVGVRVGESGGLVDGPRKSWWLFAGLSPGNMSGSVGMRSIGIWWVGEVVVCILCLKFGIQTAHDTIHWRMGVWVVDLPR